MESEFTGDIDFCPDCGSILPLPSSAANYVTCKNCKFNIDVMAFDGICIETKIFFNKRKDFEVLKNLSSSSGPLVDRKCSKCGHEGMTYKTLQTRSADEGQTVFYSCPQCKFQENENS